MPVVNQQVGPYTLLKKLGQGGFGEVWLAEKKTTFITKNFAVKLPLKEQVDADAVRHEATLWEQASGHPNVLPIIDADEFDGQIAIVSEYAPDGSLADLLKKQGRLSVEKAVEMIDGILAGLEFLHSRKIIHRDLKPDNVLLQGETPRLADFGISRVLRTTMTSSSVNLAGTPYYMAPEAFDKKRNEQTDIWAVGVMLYELLAGKRPFEEDNLINLVSSIATQEPQPLPANVPNWLNDVVRKALAKVPESRYKTASKMRLHIRQLAKMPDTNQVVVLPTPKDDDKTVTDDDFQIPTPQPKSKENNLWKAGTVALSVILLSGLGGAIYYNQPNGETSQNTNKNSKTEIAQTTNKGKNVEDANLSTTNVNTVNVSQPTNSNINISSTPPQNIFNDKYSSALESQIKCEQVIEPAKAIRSLQTSGILEKNGYGFDSVSYFKANKILTVFGFKVISVFGFEINQQSIFPRGPGTAPPEHIGVVVSNSLSEVKSQISNLGIKKATVETAETFDLPNGSNKLSATKITCYKDNF